MTIARLKTNAEYAAEFTARDREQRQCALPSRKVLERMHRNVCRHRVRGYEGYSLHVPRPGDVLMHFTDLDTGERRSIRILPSGAMRRYRPRCVTVAELMSEAAE